MVKILIGGRGSSKRPEVRFKSGAYVDWNELDDVGSVVGLKPEWATHISQTRAGDMVWLNTDNGKTKFINSDRVVELPLSNYLFRRSKPIPESWN